MSARVSDQVTLGGWPKDSIDGTAVRPDCPVDINRRLDRQMIEMAKVVNRISPGKLEQEEMENFRKKREKKRDECED